MWREGFWANWAPDGRAEAIWVLGHAMTDGLLKIRRTAQDVAGQFKMCLGSSKLPGAAQNMPKT